MMSSVPLLLVDEKADGCTDVMEVPEEPEFTPSVGSKKRIKGRGSIETKDSA